MTGREDKNITNYQDVIDSLAASGYRSDNADTILIVPDNKQNSSTTQILENTDPSAIVPQTQEAKLIH